jgi:GT2 family glycosyltransferase
MDSGEKQTVSPRSNQILSRRPKSPLFAQMFDECSSRMISVVIPSFNRKDRLLILLEDLMCQEDCEIEVIVVDDCSSDGSAEAVKNAFPHVHLIVNEVNSGCCVTRNRGIRAARGGIIVGLDSDVTIADRQLLAKMAKAFDISAKTTGFAFRVFDSDGVSDDVPRWWHPKPVLEFATKRFETNYFSGTAFAFRRDELVAAGMFPEHIFQYYEEVEVAYRIMDNDGILEYSPELAVIHHPGARGGWSNHRFFHSPRSQVLLAYGCYPFARGVFFIVTRLGRSFLKALAAFRVIVFAKGVSAGFSEALSGRVTRKPLKPLTWRRISELYR